MTEAEARAADRIFGLLPTDIGAPLRALCEEFEANATPDAIFAGSLDRVQPLLHNIASGGGTWTEYDVTFDQLEPASARRSRPARRGCGTMCARKRGFILATPGETHVLRR